MTKPLSMLRILLLATLMSCAMVFATDDDTEPSAERSRDRRGRRSYAVDRFMESLRESNSEEYERLRSLREEDRTEFRTELRRILSERRERMIAAGEIPPWPESPAHRMQIGSPESVNSRRKFQEPNPEIADLVGELRILVDEYRSESQPKRRSEIKEKMRDQLESIFKIRESERRAMIEQMESKLDHMRRIMNQRQDDKEQILKKQLQGILDEDSET